jgi:class 3 adenylate cyclase
MSELPAGTVTFLFTDIEGSTRLWEHHAEAMRAALSRHDTLVRRIVTDHGGLVFKMMGDAVYAAFRAAPDALAAALAAPRALQEEVWEEELGLLLRRSEDHRESGVAKA